MGQSTSKSVQGQGALRVREQRLNRTLDSLHDAVFTLDAATLEIVDCNAGAFEVFGYSRDELLGQTMACLHVGETAFDEFAQRLRKVLDKRFGPSELEMKRKNGTSFPAEHSIALLEDEAGNHVGWVSVVRDISRRKRAEEAVRESETRYRAIVEAFDGLIYICSQDYRVEFMNKQLIERTGYDGTGELCYKVLHDRDSICPWCVNNQVFTGETVRWEVQSPKDNHWYYVVNTPIYHTDGSMSKQAMILDITERRQVEEALRESEERYRRLLGSVTDYVYSVELQNGRPVATTHGPGCVPVTGYTPEDYSADPDLWYRMVHPDDQQAVVEQADRVLLGEGVLPLEHRIIHKDGSIRWVRNTPVARYDDQGRLLAYDGLITDITERTQAEEARLREKEAEARAAAAEAARLELEREIAEREKVEEALNKRLVALTEPLETARVSFTDLFDIEAIQKIQDAFADATHVASLITHPDGTPITCPSNFCSLCMDIIRKTDKGLANCFYSDSVIGRQNPSGPVIQPCLSGGLWDAGASITLGGQHIANWMIGQVKNEAIDEERLVRYAHEIGADEDEFRKALQEVPVMSKEQFYKVSQALFLLANELSLKAYQNIQQARFITERKRAEEALKRRASQLALLGDVGGKIAAVLDLASVLDRAAHLVQESFGYHHVALFTVDRQQGVLIMKARAGRFASLFPPNHRIRLGQGMVGWAGLHGEKLLANDVRAELRYINFAPDVIHTRSELCVPIRVGEETVGVLDAQSPHFDAFDENDALVMETLADQIAVAIENARLYEAVQRELTERRRAEETLRRRNQELVARNVIATTLGQSFDLDHILHATLDALLEVIGMSAGWIHLLDENEGALSLVAQRGFSQAMVEEAKTMQLGMGITGQVARSGQRIVLDDARQDPRNVLETSRQEELRALVAVPIKAKDNVLGVLGVFSRDPHPPSLHEVDLITSVGHQIGLAIENVRLARQASEIEILREVDRLRSELLANISHELRTPLGLIKVFCASLLEEDVEFDRVTQREFLSNIQQETERLEDLVNNLLDLSRIQNGRLWIDKCPTDVGQLAREIMKAMGIQLVQHQLVCDFSPEPLVAMVDPRGFEQVLRNLLSNAVKYSPAGGAITVQGREEEGHLLVRVSDQGIGIPAEELPKIFERFYRVENEITASVRGAGLGLAVCQGIVEAHGGRIWVESTQGAGSTFCFTLPACSSSPEDDAQVIGDEAASPFASPDER
jgi:PAS domain S-box-containing protein